MVRRRGWVMLLLWFALVSAVQAADRGELDQAIADYRAENYEEALARLQQLAAGSEDAQVLYWLGLTLKRTGDNRSARVQLQAALRLGSTEPDLCRELAEAALASDDLPGALAAVEAGEAAGGQVAEMAYFRGVIHLRNGEDSQALAAFESARSGPPEVAARAEFQAAQIHARQNRLDLARRSLQAVVRLAPTSDIAAYAADYERQFERGARPRTDWHGYVRAGYLYDDNAIAAPERPPVVLPDEKDHGLTATLGLEYAPQLIGRKLFSARYDVNSIFYADNTTSNQLTQTLTATPGIGDANSALLLPLSYTYSRLDNASYQQLASLRPTWNLRLGNLGLLQLRAGYAWRDMLFDYANPATERMESRSGDIYSAEAGYYRFFAEGQGMAGFRYEWSSERTDGDNWENLGNRLALTALVPLDKRFSIDLAADYSVQRYDNVHNLFLVQRSDETFNGAAGVTLSLADALKVFTRYQYTRADSNIAIYEYRRNTVALGCEFRF